MTSDFQTYCRHKMLVLETWVLMNSQAILYNAKYCHYSDNAELCMSFPINPDISAIALLKCLKVHQ